MEDKLIIETSSCCILCFDTVTESNTDLQKLVHSVPFKLLLRYLRINLTKLCTESLEMEESQNLQILPVDVSMCNRCSIKMQEFGHLYRNWEMIRLQLDRCVNTIYKEMEEENRDQQKLYEKEIFIAGNSIRTNSGVFVANGGHILREETKRKCNAKVNTMPPRIIIQNPHEGSPHQLKCNKQRTPEVKATAKQIVPEQCDPVEGLNSVSTEMVPSRPTTRSKTTRSAQVRLDQNQIDKCPPKSKAKPCLKSIIGKTGLKVIKNKAELKSYTGLSRSKQPAKCSFCDVMVCRQDMIQLHNVRCHKVDVYKTFLPNYATEEEIQSTFNFVKAINTKGLKKNTKEYKCFWCDTVRVSWGSLEVHVINFHFKPIRQIYDNRQWEKIEDVNTADFTDNISDTKDDEEYLKFPKSGNGKNKKLKSESKVKAALKSFKDKLGPKSINGKSCLKSIKYKPSLKSIKVKRRKNLKIAKDPSKHVQCSFCDKILSRPDKLTEHNIRRHRIEVYQALLPGSATEEEIRNTFKCVKSLNVKIWKERNEYKCFRCDVVRASWSSLELHIVGVHDKEIKQIYAKKQWNEQNVVRQDVCLESYSDAAGENDELDLQEGNSESEHELVVEPNIEAFLSPLHFD